MFKAALKDPHMWHKTIKDNNRSNIVHNLYNALCSRKRWSLERQLLTKRLILIIFCVLIQVGHSIATNIAYFRHKQAPRLRDLGFELIPESSHAAGSISEHLAFLILGCVFTASFIPYFYNPTPVHQMSLFLRVLVCIGISAVIRCICFLSTGLPGPAPHCLPQSDVYHPP
eukprot:144400_1